MNKETLTNYIVKEHWNEFFVTAKQLCKYESDKDTLDSIRMRLNRLKKDRGLGILSFSDSSVEEARIRNAALSMINDLDFTKIVTINANVADVTVNNTTVNNITVAPVTTAATSKEFDPFFIAPEVLHQLEQFMQLLRKFIILAAQTNMVLPEIFDQCGECIADIQEMAMSFVTSENSEERDEIIEGLDEYRSVIAELDKTAHKELKRALGSEKNQVAQLLKAVTVGNKKNMELFKSAYAVFEQMDKGHIVSVPKVLPVNATSLGLLVKKWIRLANTK